MTQGEKQLLLQDLCARLPYGVKGIITYNGDKDIFTIKGIFNILFLSDTECCHIEDFKPYLRSMSSMTEEEKKEFDKVLNSCNDKVFACPEKERRYKFFDAEQEDFMNAHHFDYRGLIEKRLAIEAPEGMY